MPLIEKVTGFKKGGLIFLECLSTGQPEPSVSFLTENNQSLEGVEGHVVQGTRLNIEEPSIQKSYTCVAENIYGSDTKTVSGILTVFFLLS